MRLNHDKNVNIYGTRKVTTIDTVEVIAEILQSGYNHEVVVCESSQSRSYKKRINEFDNIIIGSSIVSGIERHSPHNQRK